MLDGWEPVWPSDCTKGDNVVLVVYGILISKSDAAAAAVRGTVAVGVLEEVHPSQKSNIIFTVVTDDQAMQEIFSATNLAKPVSDLVQIPDICESCYAVTLHPQWTFKRVSKAYEVIPWKVCMASSMPQARDEHWISMCGGKRETLQ